MRYKLLAALLLLAVAVGAAEKPKIRAFASVGYIIGTISDNGKWVTLYQENEPTQPSVLVNLDSGETIQMQTEAEIAAHGVSTLLDVTNDGNIVVGDYEGVPAYYNRAAKTWTKLADQAGCVWAVTPDGHYAVGFVSDLGANDNDYEIGFAMHEEGKMWDLTTNKEVNISQLTKPFRDPKLETFELTRFMAVSPDGRYILARVLSGAEYYAYVYDRQANNGNGDFKWIGYTKKSDNSWAPNDQYMYFCEPVGMSPSGEWVVCDAYMLNGNDEHGAALRYNIKTGVCEIFNSTAEDASMQVHVVDNDGNVYAGTPQGSPIREFYIHSGKYWYSLRSVLEQRYGINFTTESGIDNTGMPFGVSADGMTFTSMCDPQFGENYVIQMKEKLVDVCAGLNLLGVYTISPAAGSRFSSIKEVRISFDREIEVVGKQNAAMFGDYNSLDGNGLYVDPTDAKTLVAAFRTIRLAEGQQYTFTLPAGTIAVAGDRAHTNELITCTFTGRSTAPVSVTSTYPAAGSLLAKIDNTSSPVLLTMDCDVLVSDNASASLYTADGQYVCALIVAYKDNSVALYPANTQYLYEGVGYTIVMDAGSVTDVTGNGGNLEYTLHLSGSYVRDVPHDVSTIFADDFNNISQSLATWMLYEGDYNFPTAAMQENFEFDEANTPWNFSIHDDDDTENHCAASHSMYNPYGYSIDWMVTPQIYIPDATCRLTFLAQSYRRTKSDYLKVVVLEKDDVINFIDDEVWDDFYYNGKLVLNALLSPGEDEERLAGDWKEYDIDLSAYAGKNIYIAFVNENEDQSMVFVDNVLVSRNVSFMFALSNDDIVENKQSIAIKGRITVNDDDTHNKLTMTLRDANGKTVSTISETALGLVKGSTYTFSFPNELPLVPGEIARFTVDIDLDGATVSESSTVKNLVFRPVKRVVLEEMTGQTCGNCPMGIIAIEEMERLFGDRFIPISIHTYTGDSWGNGLSAYTNYLGITAAPQGVVNRNGNIIGPMVMDDDDEYVTSYNGATWRDAVAKEMDKLTDMNVSATVIHNTADDTFRVQVKIRSAVNSSNQNLNIFMVLMEDNLVGTQENYYASYRDAIFGEWGRGGRYGQSKVYNVQHNDVVRACYASSFAGTPGMLPQTYVAGEEYEVELSGTVPGVVQDVNNAKVAVLIIDAATERVVNACVAAFAGGGDGVTDIRQNAAQQGTAYNLQGQRVGANYRGVVIKNGKLMIRE